MKGGVITASHGKEPWKTWKKNLLVKGNERTRNVRWASLQGARDSYP